MTADIEVSIDPSSSRPVAPINPPPWVHEFCAAFDIGPLCDEVVLNCTEVAFSSFIEDASFRAQLRASVTENLSALRDVLGGKLELNDVRLNQPLKFASIQAQLGIPQALMQKSYRVSFLVQWRAWSVAFQTESQRRDADRDDATLALEYLTATIFGYQDHVASLVAETHAREDDALGRSRQHVQQRLIRDLLNADGDVLSPSEVDTLGYPLEQSHLAILLPDAPWRTANQLARGLATVASPVAYLAYAITLHSTVLWLGKRGHWSKEAVAAVHQSLADSGVVASISDTGTGLAGLRYTLADVKEVERLRAILDADKSTHILSHESVRLEILLLNDRTMARRFVHAELGDLALDTAVAQSLRETVEASFRFGSHVAAAEHLGLHEHTVRNRLHKAEEMLGRPLLERRLELQVALRLRKLMRSRA